MLSYLALAAAALVASPMTALAQDAGPGRYDEALARSVGADEHGMRGYVMAVLKTGPRPMPAGPQRDAMFRGHFANMKRLAAEKKLVLAGPFDGADGWRGLFLFAVADVDEARKLTETDPVIASGEMVAEFHKYYGSATLMLVPEWHEKVAKKAF